MADYTEAGMRKRFHENRVERGKILAVSVPLREARDKLSQETDKKLKEMNAAIKKAEVGLYELDVEAGVLVRALKGKTGSSE